MLQCCTVLSIGEGHAEHGEHAAGDAVLKGVVSNMPSVVDLKKFCEHSNLPYSHLKRYAGL